MTAHTFDLENWKFIARTKGYQIEDDGSGKLVAHVDGDEMGLYDPRYGGSGMGWFY